MDVSLDIYILHDHAVDTHTHTGLFFKRLNMNVARPRLDGTLDQTVQKPDDRCLIVTVVQIFDLQFSHRTRCGESNVCLFGSSSGTDLGKIIGNRLFQRCFLTQQDFQLTSTLLSYFLQCEIIQRVVRHDLHIVVFDMDRQDQVLFCQSFIDHGNGFYVYDQLCHIYDPQLKSARQCLQYLRLGDKSKLHQDLSHSFISMFFLIC